MERAQYIGVGTDGTEKDGTEKNGTGTTGTEKNGADVRHGGGPAGNGTFQLEPGPAIRLAGTFYHQGSLRALAPRVPAGTSSAAHRVPVRLRHDPGSAHDGAVAVDHGDLLLGYLPRAWAPLFHEALSAGEAAEQVVTATAVLRRSADDDYVSVDLEAAPPGGDVSEGAGGPASQSGASARPSRRARSRAGWPFGTVLACVVAATAAAAVVGPSAASELVSLVRGETTTGLVGGGSARHSAL